MVVGGGATGADGVVSTVAVHFTLVRFVGVGSS